MADANDGRRSGDVLPIGRPEVGPTPGGSSREPEPSIDGSCVEPLRR